ncbi:hypothetical protein K435DRAFT_859414 [Dendrothele bispora CBS 962.96]|uniref:Uncharacterized protein n=1 Tax=Dendrothele bispora (strain CBS 962.96) TaxID=1314807 RepID=A0A4S8M0I1_DENBC|nr:hypothetical protein K435DRAFT_859414 [Dendrothele bispora CBS 962.96]
MSEIDVAQFLGCSPTLNTAVAPAGKGGQNYKYDLIPGGSNGGVYVNQKLASSLAQNTRQKEPKGYNNESLLNHTHDHVPAEKHPFCDPFAVVSCGFSLNHGVFFEKGTFPIGLYKARFWIFSRPLMGSSQPSKLSRYNPVSYFPSFSFSGMNLYEPSDDLMFKGGGEPIHGGEPTDIPTFL